MGYLLLGMALLVAFLVGARWFVSADPKTLVKSLKWVAIVIVAIAVLLLVLTGRIITMIWALPVLFPILMRLRHAARTAKNHARMHGVGGKGASSTVSSAFLEMSLDHESGEMDGHVTLGSHQGRRLSDLTLPELQTLYGDYAARDSESARLLAAFLDRYHPDWRDGNDHGTTEPPPRGNSGMSRDEALRILGLEAGADTAEIKAAHHRLIAGLHPDKGGSAYLAAKINQARDTLLGKV